MGKCVVEMCESHTNLLRKWKKEICSFHQKQNALCPCLPPMGYRFFYCQSNDEATRKIWKENLKLDLGWNNDRGVCSLHFVDGFPSRKHPHPFLKKDSPSTKRHLPATEATDAKKMRHDVDECTNNDINSLHNLNIENCKEANPPKNDDIEKINELKEKLKSLEHLLAIKEQEKINDQNKQELSCAELIKDPKIFKFYTGLTPEVFQALFKNILPYTENQRYWRGPKRGFTPVQKRGLLGKSGSDKRLNKQDQFLLWLVKCRLNLKTVDLAYRFSISSFTVSSIFTTWTKLLRPLLENFIIWPSQETISQNLPEKFKEFPRTRVIIDCFEVQIQHPKSLKAQAETYSNYKSRNTTKYLIGITPNVACSFISKGFGGRTSDKKVTKESGTLSKFEPGDDCMADRGFDIEDLLRVHGATLNIPPRTKGKQPLSANEETKTRRIASVRIYVENFIGRLKRYNILKDTIPINFVRQIDDIVVCLCALCNLS